MNSLERIAGAFIAIGVGEAYRERDRRDRSIIDIVENAIAGADLLTRSFEEHLPRFEGVFMLDVAVEFGRRAAASLMRDTEELDGEFESHVMDLLTENQLPPVVVYPPREPTNLQEALDQAVYQRNLLGQAILGAAVELDIAKPNASADGPTLMMLCKDMVDYTKRLAENNRWLRAQLPDPESKAFTVYWRGGNRSVIRGDSIEDAFSKAGYGRGAVAAIDWYDNGDTNTHDFIKGQGWVRKT